MGVLMRSSRKSGDPREYTDRVEKGARRGRPEAADPLDSGQGKARPPIMSRWLGPLSSVNWQSRAQLGKLSRFQTSRDVRVHPT